MPSYGKLVRDRIPRIIIRNGEVPILNVLSLKDFKRSLLAKLVEECTELSSASERTDIMLECADVKEVLAALCAEYHTAQTIRLQHDRPYDPDAREFLLRKAKALRDAEDPKEKLPEFLEHFSRMLDHFCITCEELERKQLQRRQERGGFEKRFYLVKVISPEAMF
jgi:predicted house-cleaning noncanonical NTP pyrophosphatase (MazG superfamily)